MTPYQYQYYSFLENARKRALYQHSLAMNALTAIRRAVNAGIDPRTDPDLHGYWILISEDDRQRFISELDSTMIVTEGD